MEALLATHQMKLLACSSALFDVDDGVVLERVGEIIGMLLVHMGCGLGELTAWNSLDCNHVAWILLGGDRCQVSAFGYAWADVRCTTERLIHVP